MFFQVKNTLKNNQYHTFKYPHKKTQWHQDNHKHQMEGLIFLK